MPTVTGDNFYINKHTLQFRTGETGVASIVYDKTDESISIANAGTGQISIGDAGGDIFIGDGTTETDIIFEQNGAIRALTNKTLKLGQGDSDVKVEAQNFLVTGDAGFSGTVTINGNTVLTGASGAEGDTLQSVTDRGAITTNAIEVANGTMISGTGAHTPAADLYIYGSGNSDVINAVRARNDASIKVTSQSAGAYFRTNSATATYNGIDLNTNWFIGQYGYNDLRIVDGTASAGDAATAITVQNTTKYVGIGTTNPDRKVVIDAGAGYPLKLNATQDYLLGLARNGTEQWWLKVNTAGDFTIHENAADDRLRIKAGGNVGIGVADPIKELQVDGSILGKNNGGFLQYDAQGNVATILNLTTANELSIGQASHVDSMSFNVGGGDDRIFINSDGNVGIGTTNPAAQLTVQGDNADFMVRSNDYTISRIIPRGDTSANWDKGLFSLFNASTEAVRIDSASNSWLKGGNVGIGTEGPNALLHVYSAGNGEIEVERNGGALINLQAQASKAVIGTDSNHQLDLKTNGGARMSLLTNGDVGIGTTAPLDMLHIYGSVRADLKLEGAFQGGTTDVAKFQFAYGPRSGDVNNRNIASISAYNTTTDSTAGGYLSISTRATNSSMSERIRVNQDGQVDIYGNASFASYLYHKGDEDTNIKFNTDDFLINVGGATFFRATETTQNTIKLNSDSTDADFYLYSTSSTPAIFMRGSDGQVGIGTSSPVTKLEVQTSSVAAIVTGLLIHNNVATTSTAGNGVGIVMGRAGGVYASKIANVWTNNNPSYLQTNIAFYTMHDSHLAGSETEKMRLTSQGRLGIGVTNPSQRLEVNPDNDSSAIIGRAKVGYFGGSDYAAFGHLDSAANDYAIRQQNNANTYINCGSSRFIQFRQQNSTQGGFTATKDFFVGPSESDNTIYVDVSTDRVGIGATSPQVELDLRGDMRLDSAGNTDRSIYFRNQSSIAKVRSDAALQFDVGVSNSPAAAMY